MSRIDIILLIFLGFVYAIGWAEQDKLEFALLWIITCKVCAAVNKYLGYD